MHNRTAIALALALASVAGCSSKTPLDGYKEHFAQHEPTHDVVDAFLNVSASAVRDDPSPANLEAHQYLLGLKQGLSARDYALSERNRRVSRTLTLDWEEQSRGGAAMRSPSYYHSLAGAVRSPRPGDREAITTEPALAIAKSIMQSEQPKKRGYSVYEMQRWERYCNGGKGMDKRDWAFVRQEGEDNVPANLRPNCIRPGA